jgi:hypothetical protein
MQDDKDLKEAFSSGMDEALIIKKFGKDRTLAYMLSIKKPIDRTIPTDVDFTNGHVLYGNVS